MCSSDLRAAEANFRVADLALELAWIKPGSFAMGSPRAGDGDERPVTRVTLSAGFWLGVTEVTQAQWTAVMGKNPSAHRGDLLPVESVTWTEARDFCRRLTERERTAGRLPPGLERQAARFVAFNHERLRRIIESLPGKHSALLQLLPLLFHGNHPGLPGFVSADTPCEIGRAHV